MKLLIVVVLCALATLGDARGNIELGDKTGANLIYHDTHDKIGIPFIRRDEEVTVHAVGDEKITAIHVQDLKGDGMSYIVSGGIGHSGVVIKLMSPRGEGYTFMIDVYAE